MYGWMDGWMDGCMYVCMYVCSMYVCMYVWMYVCTMYVVCMYAGMYVCMYVWMDVCMYVYMYVCMYVCMDVRMYVCTRLRTMYYYIYSYYNPGIIHCGTKQSCTMQVSPQRKVRNWATNNLHSHGRLSKRQRDKTHRAQRTDTEHTNVAKINSGNKT